MITSFHEDMHHTVQYDYLIPRRHASHSAARWIIMHTGYVGNNEWIRINTSRNSCFNPNTIFKIHLKNPTYESNEFAENYCSRFDKGDVFDKSSLRPVMEHRISRYNFKATPEIALTNWLEYEIDGVTIRMYLSNRVHETRTCEQRNSEIQYTLRAQISI